MIIRTWHGITDATKANEYIDYLNQAGLAEYQSTAGNLGVYVTSTVEGDWVHFQLMTLWESAEAINAFAGVNVSGTEMEKTRYYPEDKQALFEFEPTVTHCVMLPAF
jgi:heme-degrading monooxygenase HmoA